MRKPSNIKQNAQLISGVGASSWFTISAEKNLYRIERFSLEGELECSRIFKVKQSNFDINETFEFTYLSHCKECSIIQNDITFKFYTNDY